MLVTRFLCLAVATLATLAHGQSAKEFHGHLPIDLPDDANVALEADAPASELVPLIQQALSGTIGDPTAAPAKIKRPRPVTRRSRGARPVRR